ncbi:MAG: ADP-dependent (S)-NAD(P)H-hydrate dehydratase [Noviherbaspirillum sp.]|nr:ADP-dependent (S)-NAD(P)H-hydrate dehydratase [Noviherbaspirillum sp.]
MNDDLSGYSEFSVSRVTNLNNALLRAWPLPMPSADGDKEERGRILVIAGSREMPGAVILAATAALHAGAGKLTIATGASIANLVALAIPESRVIELEETPGGAIAPAAAETLGSLGSRYDAVLIGPGMQDEPATCAFVLSLLPRLKDAKVVLDACAMNVVRRQLQAVDAHGTHAQQKFIASFASPVLLTPHAGEMAHLTALDKKSIQANPCDAARVAARRWNAYVALKGAITFIADPAGNVWRHEGGNIGLAISGSGDTLAGIIAGLAARGAPLEQATAWGVALHARAGDALAEQFGPLGFLARDIAAQVPRLMHRLGRAD